MIIARPENGFCGITIIMFQAVERYIVYNVNKEEFDTCHITNPHPRMVVFCDKPHENRYKPKQTDPIASFLSAIIENKHNFVTTVFCNYGFYHYVKILPICTDL